MSDILTHHLVELFLFFARFLPWLAFYVARYVAWMESSPRVLVDDSAFILNMNCRVRLAWFDYLNTYSGYSSHSIPQNGLYHTTKQKNACYICNSGSNMNTTTLMVPMQTFR